MSPTRLYTWFASLGLFLQGTSTLTALLVPSFDRAVPFLLEQTRMIPVHSTLHIVSGLIGFAALRFGGGVGPWWFALLFGIFYAGLAVAGMLSGHQFGLGLQPFDHPFHLALGGLGLVAVFVDYMWPSMAIGRRAA